MMKLTTSSTYNHTIIILPSNSYYTKELTFHTYYDLQTPNEMYSLSIKSCAHHHSKENFRIIVWMDSNNPLLNDSAFLRHYEHYKNISIQYLPLSESESITKSEYVLYKYGGCFFSPKFVFMKPMDSLFWTYGRYVGVFQNGSSDDIRNDMLISLIPESVHFKNYIDKKNTETNMVIFPSSWIDPLSVSNPFTSVKKYEDMFQDSPFDSSVRSYCISYGESTSVNITENSFISKQLSLYQTG